MGVLPALVPSFVDAHVLALSNSVVRRSITAHGSRRLFEQNGKCGLGRVLKDDARGC